MTRDLREELTAFSRRTLDDEEVRSWLDAPIADDEREHVLALVRWFTRRYPTGAERLAYVRTAFRRWQRSAGPRP